MKVLTNEATPSRSVEAKKQHKKQAKREARLMLEIECARKDMERAEQKVAKAQAKLHAYAAQLEQLQEELAALRASQQEQIDHPQVISPEQEQPETSVPVNQIQDVPPIEGRSDILETQLSTKGQGAETASSTTATAGHAEEMVAATPSTEETPATGDNA
jgi:chromosome segregation ATPase